LICGPTGSTYHDYVNKKPIDAIQAIDLEPLTRWTATTLIALYAGGYLVTSIYFASFGFHDMSLLKPRILAAGTWLFLLTGLPVYGAHLVRQGWHLTGRPTVAKVTIRIAAFYWLCWWAVILVGPTVFVFDSASPIARGRMAWLSRGVAVACSAVAGLAISIVATMPVATLHTARILAAFAVLTFIPVIAFSLPKPEAMTEQAVTLWLFSCGVIYMYGVWFFRRHGTRSRESFWLQCGAAVLATIAGFSTLVYPHIKAEWGGGTPKWSSTCQVTLVCCRTVSYRQRSWMNPNLVISFCWTTSDMQFSYLGL
jgi:hypothetical protein